MPRTKEQKFIKWSDGSITKITREVHTSNGKTELSDYIDTDTYTVEESAEIVNALQGQ